MAKIALHELGSRINARSLSRRSVLSLSAAVIIFACGPRVDVPGSDVETSAGSGDDAAPIDATCGDGIPTPGQYCFAELSLEPWRDEAGVAVFAGQGRIAESSTGHDRVLRVLEVDDRGLVEVASIPEPVKPPAGQSPDSSQLIAMQLDDDPELELIHYGFAFDHDADGVELLGFVDGLGSVNSPYDVNADGIDELIQGGFRGSPAWSVRVGGSLEPASGPLFPCPQLVFAIADLDGDGRDDLVGATVSFEDREGCESIYSSTAAEYVHVALNRWHEQGSDNPMLVERIAARPWDGMGVTAIRQLHVGDVTGDGHADIVSDSFTGEVLLWRGQDDGTFAEAEPLPLQANRLAVGDFDGDSVAEIAGWPLLGGLAMLSIWRADDWFETPVSVAPIAAGPMTTADVNGDGVGDLLPSAILVSDP